MSFSQKSLALTAEQVSAKLRTVAVYVVMKKGQGNAAEMLFTRLEDGSIFIPLFLQKQPAEKRLQFLNDTNNGGSNLIVSMPLSQALAVVEEVRALDVNKGVKILAPVAGSQQDRDKAEAILKADGLSDDQIQSGLIIPVFYTEPMIQVATSKGKKQAFFFESDQLKEFAIKSFGDDVFDKKKLVMKVGDLNAILSIVKNEEKDLYVFYPNSVYIESNPKIINAD